MSFHWEKYVYLAEELMNRKDDAYLRSSISRAYYGVWCLARNKKGYKRYKTRKGENIHWKVINEYKNSNDRNEQNIGRILDKLRRLRDNADYNEDRLINKDLAERSVISAKNILNILGIK